MADIRVLFLSALALHGATSAEIVGTPNVTIYEGEYATLSCTTGCSTGDQIVLWSTRYVWLVNIFNEFNSASLGTRQCRFSLRVSTEECNAEGTLHRTISSISIVDADQADAGVYRCYTAGTNFLSTIKLKVVPLWLPIPTCSQIPMFAVTGDLVNISCASEAEVPSSTKLSLLLYNAYDHTQSVVKTMNQSEPTIFAINHVHTITSEDDGANFICETKFLASGNEQATQRCSTNTIHVIPTTSVQVLPLNNTPFYLGDRACFICIITTGSHLDVEYLWSRIDYENEIHPGTNQHCIDEIRPEDDQQLIICNVSNKYHLYATGNTSISVAVRPTTLASYDRPFRWQLLLWILLPTNAIIIMMVVLATCFRKCKYADVDTLQLSGSDRSIDSVAENKPNSYDQQDHFSRPVKALNRSQQSPDVQDKTQWAPDLSGLGHLYRSFINKEKAEQRSPDTASQEEIYQIIQDPIYNTNIIT